MNRRYVSDIHDYIFENRIEELAEISSVLPEDLIKTAQIPMEDELNVLPNEAFALILVEPDGNILRKYACNTKELAILNTELFLKDYSEIPDEIIKIAGYHLARACFSFKYNEGLNKLSKFVGADKVSNTLEVETISVPVYEMKLDLKDLTEKTAYALPDIKKYPLTSESDVQSAIEYFNIYEDKFSQLDKFIYSVNTKHAASKFNVSISDDDKISKFAHLNVGKLSNDVELHINIRQKLVDEDSDSYKLYEELKEKTSEYDSRPLEFSDLLSKADNFAKISQHWGGILDDPIRCCLETIKTSSINIDERTVSLTDIKTMLDNEKIAELLDDYTRKELGSFEALQVFSSIPYPVRQELYNLL